MFNLIIKIMPYLILFFLLAIAIVVIIVIVTRASMRNKYSAEIRTLMEITDQMADNIPADKLKKLQNELCDRQNLIRGDKDDQSDFKIGKMRAYDRMLRLLNQKVVARTENYPQKNRNALPGVSVFLLRALPKIPSLLWG